MNSQRIRIFATLFTCFLMFIWGAAGWMSVAAANPEEASPFRNLAVFARALSHIELSYVDAVDQDALISGAIRGMVATLDPHSTYLDPEEMRILDANTRGAFGGIGVTIEVEDGWLTVLSVFEEGPAHEAGVRAGDRFLRVSGRSARDMRVDDAVRLMRGDPGTEVEVALRRQGQDEDIELTLTRRIIDVIPVEANLLADRTLHLKVRSFQENTMDAFVRALDTAERETRDHGGLAGIVLDLRNNGGGLLSQSVMMVDQFIASGVIVSTRGRDGEPMGELSAHRRGTRPDYPIVVLVNGYTASASEIVAGALRDHRRAVVVGERTFGKGSVQNVVQLPDGSAIKLTIARYYTPSGRSIQAQGIEPDVRVEALNQEALDAAEDSSVTIREATLPRHLRAGDDVQTDAPAAPVDRRQPRSASRVGAFRPFSDDYQARMAHQVLRGLIAAD